MSAITRERVIEAATSIGYVPNHHARSLKRPHSNIVAVLTANIANHYYSVLVSNIESTIEGEGFDCVTMDAIFAGDYSRSREDRFVSSIMAQRVAAVVVTYSLSPTNLKALAGWGVPIVFVDCVAPEGTEHPSVSSDSFQGSHEMGLHLAGHGYTRWAFVGHTSTWGTRQPRQSGFEAAADRTGSVVDIIEGLNSSATAQNAVTRYLVETPRLHWPQAIYASNTVLLHGTLEALRAFDLAVPDNIAVVAFDDFEWASLLDPPLTVVDQDIAAIGRAAGLFLLQRLRMTERHSGQARVFKPTLRIRRSCGCGCLPSGPQTAN